ncbi:hypothetical protein HU200_008036 [Digitaria exilis]|uniref:Myb/SANT-like domain-containing protein n=1 Tax=Digitaria exilis TaxID=1010633 RepID=A0A835FLF7_9POAL|nr:hypothetical protein HU200_008036 [Digitaria exilis]
MLCLLKSMEKHATEYRLDTLLEALLVINSRNKLKACSLQLKGLAVAAAVAAEIEVFLPRHRRSGVPAATCISTFRLRSEVVVEAIVFRWAGSTFRLRSEVVVEAAVFHWAGSAFRLRSEVVVEAVVFRWAAYQGCSPSSSYNAKLTQMDGGRANWDEETTKAFLDLCIDEKNKLNFNKRSLTKDGWENMYKISANKWCKKQLQNKFTTLKRQYKLWRDLKDKSGAGWDKNTGTINCTPEWWTDRIADNENNKQFRGKRLPFEDELAFLFDSMDSEDGDMLCVGGLGDKTPSGASEENLDPMAEDNNAWSEDNIGRSSVGRTAKRPGKEKVVDSPLKRARVWNIMSSAYLRA